MSHEFEHLKINGKRVRHMVVPIEGDGACLFSSISYLLYGTENRSAQIRATLVRYVVRNWAQMQFFTCTSTGTFYSARAIYRAQMSRTDTYGTTAEIIAACHHFNCRFQVFEDGKLMFECGEPGNELKKLKFSGDALDGHFDVLLPCEGEEEEEDTSEEVPGYAPHFADTFRSFLKKLTEFATGGK